MATCHRAAERPEDAAALTRFVVASLVVVLLAMSRAVGGRGPTIPPDMSGASVLLGPTVPMRTAAGAVLAGDVTQTVRARPDVALTSGRVRYRSSDFQMCQRTPTSLSSTAACAPNSVH
jgi:hypothetical protein